MTKASAKIEAKPKLQLLDDPSVREPALRVGYNATDWNHRPSYRDYVSSLKDWTVRLLARKTEPIGAVYTKGPEFHVSVLRKWRGRWATRGILKKIIPEPFAMTRITPGHEHVGDLLGRIGFVRVEEGVYTKGVRHGN